MTQIIITCGKEFIHDLAVEMVRVMMDVEIEPAGNGYTRAEQDKDVEKSYTMTFTLSGDRYGRR